MKKERSEQRYILPRQAARMADCGETYIHSRARVGSFISERIAGRVLIDRESFLAWLELYKVRRHRHPETEQRAEVFA